MIEDELERIEHRRGREIFNPPVVRSLADIKRLLGDLDPTRQVAVVEATLQTELKSMDDNGQSRTYKVSAETPAQTKRSILLTGFSMIKKRLDLQQLVDTNVVPTLINGIAMRPALSLQINSYMWVEPLLRRWLNAYRDGLWICWQLDGWLYRYDIFSHKIFRIKQA